jgi:putative addiction module component (TIGR02574 family)
MSTITIRRKLFDYIRDADAQKVKAIFTLVQNDIDEENDIWTQEFTEEMERRIKEFKEGKVKAHTWEEVKKKSMKKLKMLKNK